MNYFAHPTAAERYASGRPFFHPLAIERIRKVCCEGSRINRALDVGCGTGQSTLALLDIAGEVVGLDISGEMLSWAPTHQRIRYVEAPAERMPFDNATFELVTVGLAFHWFDQQKFARDAHRVLRPDGWLVIYNDGFGGQMNGNADFEKWSRESYLPRYPTPPRNSRSLTEADASASGFAAHSVEQFVHEVEFTPTQLVDYLLTHTNIISAVEAGSENLNSVANWLLSSIQPMFAGPTATFPFHCQIQFLKRA